MISLFNIQDKVIIVTGGLGQLGRQFTLALLSSGAKVAVFDTAVTENKVAAVFGDTGQHSNLLCLNVDVTDPGAITDGLSTVITKWGPPHGLVNNAAIDSPPNAPAGENGPFETYPLESWNKVLNTNVNSVFLCCRIVGGHMARAAGGSIVNICSTYGMVSPDQRLYDYRNERDGVPFFKPAAYSASKSALLNLTRYLATYWAKSAIRVNTLTLGGIFNHQDKPFLDAYCRRVPLNRMANEDEYNGALIFLLSAASSYMTGSNLIMDGGWTAW